MSQGSGSIELLAGSVSLGAEMNYVRPQPVPAGASPPGALSLAAFGLQESESRSGVSNSL